MLRSLSLTISYISLANFTPIFMGGLFFTSMNITPKIKQKLMINQTKHNRYAYQESTVL